MVMPVLSVTAIGLLVGLIGGVYRSNAGQGLIRGVIGAWVGFAAGAIPGVILDVSTAGGSWLPWLGHAGALVGAAASFLVRKPALAIRPRR